MLESDNQLKGEVSGLFEACKNVVEKMDLVDVLQHLGIDHHFKEQIATTLRSIHMGEFNSSSLHEVALRFRLLRQHGFWVSAGVFEKFKHEDGSFINDITNDLKGLLSLYSVANLFNTRRGWWKDLFEDIGLQYVRDRIVECYFWAYSVYYEQEYARARMILVRIFMLTCLLDDTYDGHATLEESRELTKAIERCDESDISLLPEYMKNLFLKVLRNFKEFEDELEPHEKYRIAYARKGFQLISKSYLQEAEWSHHDHIPSFNDHVNVSTISRGGQVMCIGLLAGMGDVATKEVFEWAIGNTNAIRASGEVSRFMDDMANFKRGRNKMDVVTSVECYMKEHNVSAEVALAKIVLQRVTNFAMSMMIFFLDQRDGYTNSKGLKETLESQFVKHIPL
uniref:Terpene synthase metal-binding domain-containing protein n=1 Tax=Setaria viridis TaxID=4556 RepID=A0A4U6U3A5_SETVI|nr:hypothetical protein SEVIR_6G086800v2 [Setaria viridis]